MRYLRFKGINDLGSYPCNMCDFECKLKTDLKKHIKEIHNGKQNWFCKICNRKFSRRGNLRPHILQVHEGKKRRTKKSFKKRIIDSVQTNKNTATDHMDDQISKNDSEKEESFEDFELNYSFKTSANCLPESTFSKKNQISTNVILKPTELSNETIDTLEDQKLESNFEQKGSNETIDMLEDQKLESNFEQRNSKKPHKCNVCLENFAESDKLKLHKLIVHDGKKPFKCTGCNYKSSMKGNVTKHIRNDHKGQKVEFEGKILENDIINEPILGPKKRYDCKLCGGILATSSSLKMHVKTVHESNKLFKCSGCWYRSSDGGNVRKHIKNRHGEEPFEILYLGRAIYKIESCSM